MEDGVKWTDENTSTVRYTYRDSPKDKWPPSLWRSITANIHTQPLWNHMCVQWVVMHIIHMHEETEGASGHAEYWAYSAGKIQAAEPANSSHGATAGAQIWVPEVQGHSAHQNTIVPPDWRTLGIGISSIIGISLGIGGGVCKTTLGACSGQFSTRACVLIWGVACLGLCVTLYQLTTCQTEIMGRMSRFSCLGSCERQECSWPFSFHEGSSQTIPAALGNSACTRQDVNHITGKHLLHINSNKT